MTGLYRVSKTFEEKQVLQDFTLALPEGDSVALMGPSGSGKTTMMRLMAGLEAPDAGQVEGFVGRRIAYQFQEDRLLPWYTVRKNLSLFAKGDVDPWLEGVGLLAEADKLPAQLSGGMRRRVALARALAYDGEVLMLDEPLKEMDEALRARMLRLIAEAAVGKQLILITHQRSEAEALCGRIVTVSGMPAEIVSDTGAE